MQCKLYKSSQRQQQWPTALILLKPSFTVFPRSCLGIKKTKLYLISILKIHSNLRHAIKYPVGLNLFDINDLFNIKLPPLKTFLSHIDTKAKFTEYLGKALLANFSDLEKKLNCRLWDNHFCKLSCPFSS